MFIYVQLPQKQDAILVSQQQERDPSTVPLLVCRSVFVPRQPSGGTELYKA